MVIVQDAPTATLPPQVLVCVKLPLAVMLLMCNGAVPVFFRITSRPLLTVPTTWLPNNTAFRDKLTAGATPVPLKVTICGLLVALSSIVRFGERAPAKAGVKVTLIVQLCPAATLPPQVLVSTKSPGLAPNIVMLESSRVAFPVLLRVTPCAALVVPTFWLANTILVGFRVTTGNTVCKTIETSSLPLAVTARSILPS